MPAGPDLTTSQPFLDHSRGDTVPFLELIYSLLGVLCVFHWYPAASLNL
jgi:hypothetical protein